MEHLLAFLMITTKLPSYCRSMYESLGSFVGFHCTWSMVRHLRISMLLSELRVNYHVCLPDLEALV